MNFETQSDNRNILSNDAMSRKWYGSSTIKCSNLGNFYIIKVTADIQSSFGIGLNNFELKYLKNGSWQHIANGYDIENDILKDFPMTDYDNIDKAYDGWLTLCKNYILNIEYGL